MNHNTETRTCNFATSPTEIRDLRIQQLETQVEKLTRALLTLTENLDDFDSLYTEPRLTGDIEQILGYSLVAGEEESG